jgi:hypothetical protein
MTTLSEQPLVTPWDGYNQEKGSTQGQIITSFILAVDLIWPTGSAAPSEYRITI